MVHPFVLVVALLTPFVLKFAENFHMPAVLFPVVLGMIVSTFGPSVMYLTAQHVLGNRSPRKYLMIPMLMLIGVGLAINNTWAVIDALVGRDTAFHRTPKKGEQSNTKYRPRKDWTSLVELAFGAYCLAAFYVFVGETSMLVTPFLAVYAAGFLFVGSVSIAHRRRPKLVDMPVSVLWAPRAAA
jgi:hypothetical protein